MKKKLYQLIIYNNIFPTCFYGWLVIEQPSWIFSICGLTTIFLVSLHIWGIYKYCKKYNHRFSAVVIGGSILLPSIFLALLGWGNSWVNQSSYGGYEYALLPFIYLVVMPIYWVIMWLNQKIIKKSISSYNTESSEKK